MQRYSRQIILPNFGEETQKKLQKSKVLVVGAGGLGVPVLQYLAAAGVGTIGIVDGDAVELSNLHRQVIYRESDLGQNKAEKATEILQKTNTEIHFRAHPVFLNSSNVFGFFEQYDVIVDCTDNFPTRYLINDVCFLLKKPLVFASIFQYEAQLSVFHYGENSFNLRDLFAEIPDENTVPNCGEAGVIGVLAGIAGCFQANEVIKIITKIGEVNSGKLLLFNSFDYSTHQITLSKKRPIFLPKIKEEILEKEYYFSCTRVLVIKNRQELQRILSEKEAVLIDVRNEDEIPKIENFKHVEIPLDRLLLSLEQCESYNTLVFVCKSGIRSKKATEIAQKKFPEKKIYTVEGGISLLLNH